MTPMEKQRACKQKEENRCSDGKDINVSRHRVTVHPELDVIHVQATIIVHGTERAKCLRFINALEHTHCT